MSRWFQAVRIAGYPTRFEAECAEWKRKQDEPMVQRILFDDGVEIRIRWHVAVPRYWGVVSI